MRKDKNRFVTHNCFETEEEAEFHVEEIKVENELLSYEEEHNEMGINWQNVNQPKWFMSYDLSYDEIVFGYTYDLKESKIYFTSGTVVENAVKEIGEDRLKKYYFKVED